MERLTPDDDEPKVALETRKQALKRVQAWARALTKTDGPVVEEFLVERRQEAGREARED